MLAALLLASPLASLPALAATSPADWTIANGHFFTQTGGGGGKGYSVVDNGGVKFWSEFQRLGGVAAIGYPASQPFALDGFIVQVFQRVIMQWRPDSATAAFVNVFDRLSELGKDEFLFGARQVPPPRPFDDAGKSWDEIVQARLAVLEPFPALKEAYFSTPGDPIQMNGLPVSDVVDMGHHYALRAQRVVFQLWKEDVPWAGAGQVTVALGGDLAKEAGMLDDVKALRPEPPVIPPWATPAQILAMSDLQVVGFVQRTNTYECLPGECEQDHIGYVLPGRRAVLLQTEYGWANVEPFNYRGGTIRRAGPVWVDHNAYRVLTPSDRCFGLPPRTSARDFTTMAFYDGPIAISFGQLGRLYPWGSAWGLTARIVSIEGSEREPAVMISIGDDQPPLRITGFSGVSDLLEPAQPNPAAPRPFVYYEYLPLDCAIQPGDLALVVLTGLPGSEPAALGAVLSSTELRAAGILAIR